MSEEDKIIYQRLIYYNDEEHLAKRIIELQHCCENFQSKIDNAIEYIKEHQRKDEFLNLNEWQSRDLLNILNGRSDKEMNKKAIVVEMPIIEGIDFLEIAKTFDDEQLSYVVALAKAYSDLDQELQRKDNNWNELKRYIKTSYDCWDLQTVLDKMEELEKM